MDDTQSADEEWQIAHCAALTLGCRRAYANAEVRRLTFSLFRERNRFSRFSAAKRKLDTLSGLTGWRLHDLRRTCVSGMARLGIAPHVADKVLNHQSGTISGVAAVYQRHDFLRERKVALERWGAHVLALTIEATVRRVA